MGQATEIGNGNGGRTVYIVEPDGQLGEKLRATVSVLNGAVRCFTSAEAFLPAYEPGCPACLITELELPGWSGLELLVYLERHDLRTPSLVLASDDNIRDVVTAMQHGAVGCVRKPIHNAALLKEVRRILE